MNFDNADLHEVIRTFAEILGINYIIEPGIGGTVTIQTSGKLGNADLFSVFHRILEVNGLTAVKEGNLFKIGQLKDASRLPIRPKYGRRSDGGAGDERVVIQIIPLDHVSVQEMAQIITPFVSLDGAIIAHDDSNTIVVVDNQTNIGKILNLVNAFDIDIFDTVLHRFIPVKHMSAETMAELLESIFSAYGRGEKKQFKLIPIDRLNTIMVISSDPADLEQALQFVERIDAPGEGATARIYVYSVKNGSAEELGDLLNSVFTGTQSSGSGTQNTKTSSQKENTTSLLKSADQDSKEGKSSTSEGSGAKKSVSAISSKSSGKKSRVLKDEVSIIPDITRNALIIEAVPSDYQLIHNLLKQIDVLPRQVLIEVVIAEITLDNKEELGVEWEYLKGDGDPDTSLLSAQMGSAGLEFILGETDRWTSIFSALATKNKLNILSAPIVLASDNKEASIHVTDQIPTASSEYLYDSNDGVTETNIQYKDTGIILKVTPHINERGLVSMEISQEVSEEGGEKTVGDSTYPSFRERKVETALTVKHGQTIVIGGLMREKNDINVNGVPYLSDIPVIGFLFGKDKNEFEKTELILLITPRVIINSDDIDTVTQSFKRKISQIQEAAPPLTVHP